MQRKFLMKFVFVFMCAAVLFGAAGCVSYSYTGEKCARESAAVAVFTDSAKIKTPYKVLGQAVVSGSYQHVTRDRMIAKLRSEAQACGADAVLIVEQQVLTRHAAAVNSREKGFFTAFDYDDTSRSWGELYRDVDVTIGNIGKKNSTEPAPGIADYKRIIRAEFLRYNDGKKSPAGK